MLDKDCFFKDVGSMQQSNFHEAYEDDPADPQTFMDFHSSNTERRKEREKAKEHDAELCEMKNIGRVQEFFLQEVQLGEHWLSRGDHKKSVEHLTNAISVCAQPHQLLQVLHNTLPPQVFEMLMRRVPYAKQRLQAALNEQDCAEDEKE
ncbi:TOMM20-like protein 1 isoform X2 [Chelonia mydas]|uniref:TOMM20-like protein 1 isoform X2 n=1 Tax=Chelonia mydas TaxID=8469 RepID=UPI0018A1E63C|nr:TOMM20-like protein 1 isoform X2 [Chelonia mydas]